MTMTRLMTLGRSVFTLRTWVSAALVAAVAGLALPLYAQEAPAAPAPPAAEAAPPAARPAVVRTAPRAPRAAPAPLVPVALQDLSQEERDFTESRRYDRPVVRVGVPYVLAASGEVSDATIIMGDATIDGRVSGGLVVVMGDVHIGSTAAIRDGVVVVGGKVTIDQGATIGGDLAVVGGVLDAPAGFIPRGDHVVIGPPVLGEIMRAFVPWVTHGLMWGRVLVPSVAWLWWIVAVFLAISVVLVLAFPGGVNACTDTLRKRPLASFVTGMLTLLLVGPLMTLLAVSVVGVIVVPFVLFATIGGWMIGKVAVARTVGGGLLSESDAEDRLQSLRSMLIGFAIITLAYMVPMLGIAAWTVVGVLGVGTGTLTLLASMKRERPAKPVPPVTPPPAPGSQFDVPTAAVPVAMTVDYGEPAGNAPFAAAPPPVGAPPAAAWTAAAPGGVDLTTFPRAMFLDRAGALVLDLLLAAVAFSILRGGPFRHFGDDFFFMVFLVYRAAFWAWKGTTVGGIICNLRVVRMDGRPLQPVDAVVRGLVSILSAAALGLGYFWVLLDSNPERQTWHDKVAGTVVVRVPKNYPVM